MLLANAFKGTEYKMFYVCSGLMLVGAIYFLWVFRGTGLLIGKSGSGSVMEPGGVTAGGVASDPGVDATLSEDADATICLAENSVQSDTARDSLDDDRADADEDTENRLPGNSDGSSAS